MCVCEKERGREWWNEGMKGTGTLRGEGEYYWNRRGGGRLNAGNKKRRRRRRMKMICHEFQEVRR